MFVLLGIPDSALVLYARIRQVGKTCVDSLRDKWTLETVCWREFARVWGEELPRHPPPPPRGCPLSGVVAGRDHADHRPEELLVTFEERLRQGGGVPHRAGSVEELAKLLQSICTEAKASTAVISRNPLLSQLQIPSLLQVLWAPSQLGLSAVREQYPRARITARRVSPLPVGITGRRFCLGRDGTLAVSSQTEGSQLSSLAPPGPHRLVPRSAN